LTRSATPAQPPPLHRGLGISVVGEVRTQQLDAPPSLTPALSLSLSLILSLTLTLALTLPYPYPFPYPYP